MRFSIVHRITALAGFCALVAFCGIWVLLRLEYANTLRTASTFESFAHRIELARATQIGFKKQVQEWKNILLRGRDSGAFHEHRTEFFQRESDVVRNAEALLDTLDENPSRDVVVRFVSAHRDLGIAYRETLESFVYNGRSDNSSADKLVQGIDRKPTELLDEIVTATKSDLHRYREACALAVERNQWYWSIGSAIVFGFMVVASFVLARRITNPIHELALTISKVSEQRDYSIRAPHPGRDEVGLLAAGFNEMLATIQEQNAALETGRDQLELLVAKRTRELEDEIRDRHQAEKQAREQYRNLRVLLDLVPAAVVFKDTKNNIILGNKFAADASGVSVDAFEGSSVFDLHPQEAPQYYADDLEVVASRKPKLGIVERLRSPSGKVRWLKTDKVPVFDEQREVSGILMMAHDITEQRETEAEMERMSKQLLQLSRQAGMSEVASGVLHNVGNVLNSVNISCSVTAEKVRKSRVAALAKTAALLREHARDLPSFVATHPSGQKLPEFLSLLSERLLEEQAGVLHELELLGKNLEHVKEVVAAQQSYANLGGMIEPLSIIDLMGDALRMSDAAFRHHLVDIQRDFEAVPLVRVDKHKVLQILVNLLRNAKHALIDSGREDKRLRIRIGSEKNDLVSVEITDNGIGIPPENLTRIFAHGFTTKKNGHGFGLHSAALAAQEMGGKLTVQSEGSGTGATFTLYLQIAATTVMPTAA